MGIQPPGVRYFHCQQCLLALGFVTYVSRLYRPYISHKNPPHIHSTVTSSVHSSFYFYEPVKQRVFTPLVHSDTVTERQTATNCGVNLIQKFHRNMDYFRVKVAREELRKSKGRLQIHQRKEWSWSSRNVGCQLELGWPCAASSGLTPAFTFSCFGSVILCHAPYVTVETFNCE